MNRVLVLAPIFFPCSQSASQRISSFVEALASEHFEPIVVACSRCLRRGMESSQHSDILIYNFGCPRFLLSSSFAIVNPIVLLLYFFLSFVVITRKRVDVFLVSVPAGEPFIVGFLFSGLFKVRLVVDVRDMYPPPSDEIVYIPTPSKLNDLLIRFFRVLYKNSDKIICVDASVQRRLTAYGVSPEKTAVISNGADTSVYQPCSSPNREEIRIENDLPVNKFIFVYAGALAWYYPVVEVIRGLKKLSMKTEDAMLLVISHAGYAYEKKLVEELGLESMVRFMGPLSMADTARILSACDVGLVVYRGDDYWRDMYGGKIFSYMSCELPILASGPPGSVIHKLLQKHRTGFFVGPPDENNFAKGLSYFVNNRNEVKIMGENARKVVRRFYDRRRLSLKLVSLIDELCVQSTL